MLMPVIKLHVNILMAKQIYLYTKWIECFLRSACSSAYSHISDIRVVKARGEAEPTIMGVCHLKALHANHHNYQDAIKKVGSFA